MSILIKGEEMPKNCWRCLLSQLYDKPREMLVCKITHEEVLRYEIDSNCPLIEVDDNEFDEAIKALKGVREASRIITEVFCYPRRGGNQ